MRFRRYAWRGSIFGIAGAVSAAIELVALYLLTQLGLWYMYSAIVGHIIGGLVLYNLNIVSGNIKLAGHVSMALAECGCTVKWNLVCPQCGNCLTHCVCAG